ncbi:MAG TPA: ABC transporter substrate-binding protein [Stellaceae bacterium]|nr:ABC transporter substrate-binding protein [Stellaceae bacterium]
MRRLALIAIVPLLLAAGGAARAELLINLEVPISGSDSAFGDGVRRAAEMAAARIAAGKRTRGRIALTVLDTACPGPATMPPRAGLVIGPFCPGSSLGLVVSDQETGTVRLGPPEAAAASIEGTLAARRAAREYPGRKLALVGDRSPHGEAFADAARAALRSSGSALAVDTLIKPSDHDDSALIALLKTADVAAVLVGLYPTEAGDLARIARARGLALPLIGGETLADDRFGVIAGKAAEGTIFAAPKDPFVQPDAQPIVAALRAAAIEPTAQALFAYTAVEALAEAADAARSERPAKIAAVLSGAQMVTALGPLTFEPAASGGSDDVADRFYGIYRWRDGRVQPDR